jgi:hypothetical protein
MKKVKLVTSAGEFVAFVVIPPFQKPADAVLWGSRTFAIDQENSSNADLAYREIFVVAAVDFPSPGNYLSIQRPIEDIPPVDRSNRTTTDGSEPDLEYAKTHGAPAPIDPLTGQHESYWVLNDEERGKGLVRPLRDAYKHRTCGAVTTMGKKLAETYARDPKFYGSTFCVRCKSHFPVTEFNWYEFDGRLSGVVGT